MKPKEIIEELVSNPLPTILVLVVGLLLFLAGKYFQGFFVEKGKQHAGNAGGRSKKLPPSKNSIQYVWKSTCEESQEHLVKLVAEAKNRLTVFGLTRNFYMSDTLRSEIAAQSQKIPIVFFMMDPNCEARRDRYRIEPIEAALEDPKRYIREIEAGYLELLQKTADIDAGTSDPGLAVYYYNFPCSFAIEESDDTLRVMLYGHGKRGTDGPILSLNKNSDIYDFFSSQLRWLEGLARNPEKAPWKEKGIIIRKLQLAEQDADDQLPARAESKAQ